MKPIYLEISVYLLYCKQKNQYHEISHVNSIIKSTLLDVVLIKNIYWFSDHKRNWRRPLHSLAVIAIMTNEQGIQGK